VGWTHGGRVQVRVQERRLERHTRRVHPRSRAAVVAAGLRRAVVPGRVGRPIVRRRPPSGLEQAGGAGPAAEVLAAVALHQLVGIDAAVGGRPLSGGHPDSHGVLY
jgi:hypothetical protein